VALVQVAGLPAQNWLLDREVLHRFHLPTHLLIPALGGWQDFENLPRLVS
jgi:hypothetical protein